MNNVISNTDNDLEGMDMKRWISILLAVMLLIGCTGTVAAKQERTELVVFAAASLTETLTEIT